MNTERHMTAAQYLAAARDMIEERGWTQHAFSAADGSLCAMGALNRVSGGRGSEFHQAARELDDVVRVEDDYGRSS